VGIPLDSVSFRFKKTFVSVDDSYLQRAASAIPKHALFLIEDIDCAFPSRDEDEEEDEPNLMTMMGGGGPARQVPPGHRSVTLSGLLNVIDGIGSEEGKLFFATVR
jgi:chaperone BCS1